MSATVTVTGPPYRVWRSNACLGHITVMVNGLVVTIPTDTPTVVSDSVVDVLNHAGITYTAA